MRIRVPFHCFFVKTARPGVGNAAPPSGFAESCEVQPRLKVARSE
jgi:hypothetical protein